MEFLYFGQSDQPLLGVYHPALRQPESRLLSSAYAGHAVLICPSIGHEYIRSHWAIKRLATQLSRVGIPCLRFDYRGTGDSSLNLTDVHSIDIWHKDILCAVDELRSQSDCSKISIVALRFGALIAASVAHKIPELEKLVFWEPIFDGKTVLSDWRSMHSQMIDLWNRPIRTINNEASEEILGSLFQRTLLSELSNSQFDPSRELRSPYVVVGQSGERDPIDSECERNRKKFYVDDPNDWNDLRSIETAWLPMTGPATIVQLLREPSIIGVTNP